MNIYSSLGFQKILKELKKKKMKFKGLDKKSCHVKEWCPYGCSGAYGKSETQNLQWRRACKSEVKGELH